MKKIFVLLLLIFCIKLPAQAFQDCVVIGNGKLTDISIEHNDIIDVFPMFTIMNEKNTLFVQPLKVGKTKFSVLKNKKNKVTFVVEVSENETKINSVEGFEIFVLDEPIVGQEENDYDWLDLPPGIEEK